MIKNEKQQKLMLSRIFHYMLSNKLSYEEMLTEIDEKESGLSANDRKFLVIKKWLGTELITE